MPPNAPSIGLLMDLAAQSVADGRYTTCLAMYPTGNHGGNAFINMFPMLKITAQTGEPTTMSLPSSSTSTKTAC